MAVLAVVVIVIALYFAYYVASKPQTTTTASTLPSTSISIVSNHIPYPPSKIGNYTYVITEPFPINETPELSSGYLAGEIFTYAYASNNLILRFLSYSNLSYAEDTYTSVTNFTINSTTFALPSLPANYRGVEQLQPPNMTLFAVSTLYGSNVITVVLIHPSSSALSASNATGFLVNASKLLMSTS